MSNPPMNEPTHTELFGEIGMKLRAAREARGFSVEDLSATTRINLSFLKQIEAGDWEGLPGPAFVRGFIRNYMQAVELDDPELLRDFNHFLGIKDPAPAGSLEPPGAMNEGSPLGRLPLGRLALLVAAVLLVAWAGYLIYRVGSAPPVATPVVQGNVPAVAAPSAEPPPEVPAAATPAPPAGASTVEDGVPPRVAPAAPPPVAPSAVPPLEPRQGLKLTVRGLEETWIRLSVDREPPVDVLVEPAETLNWEANEEFRLTIGKSHGVAVYLNGEDIILPEERNMLIPAIVLNKLTLLKLEN